MHDLPRCCPLCIHINLQTGTQLSLDAQAEAYLCRAHQDVNDSNTISNTMQPKSHLGALPLTQRDLFKLLGKAQLICQLEQISHGVSPRGEHKDEGGGVAGVLEGACQVEGGWLCEAAAQMLCYKALDALRHLYIKKSIPLRLFVMNCMLLAIIPDEGLCL